MTQVGDCPCCLALHLGVEQPIQKCEHGTQHIVLDHLKANAGRRSGNVTQRTDDVVTDEIGLGFEERQKSMYSAYGNRVHAMLTL